MFATFAVLACTPFFDTIMLTLIARGAKSKAKMHSKLLDDFKENGGAWPGPVFAWPGGVLLFCCCCCRSFVLVFFLVVACPGDGLVLLSLLVLVMCCW